MTFRKQTCWYRFNCHFSSGSNAIHVHCETDIKTNFLTHLKERRGLSRRKHKLQLRFNWSNTIFISSKCVNQQLCSAWVLSCSGLNHLLIPRRTRVFPSQRCITGLLIILTQYSKHVTNSDHKNIDTCVWMSVQITKNKPSALRTEQFWELLLTETIIYLKSVFVLTFFKINATWFDISCIFWGNSF